MNTNNYSQILQNKINQFILLNKTTPDKGQIQQKSIELTLLSKQPSFINVAHQLLTQQHGYSHEEKDKIVLLTSLVKDKFKFQFQSLKPQLQLHYKQLVQIAQKLKKTTYSIYTNIALSLAYTYIQLVASQPASLQQYLAPLYPQTQDSLFLFNFYFKTLEYIGTQVDNNKFVIDGLQRQTAKLRIIAQQLAVLQGLDQISKHAFNIKQLDKDNVLYCFQAWISLNYNAEVLNSLPNHNLFKQCIARLQDVFCGEAASNCIRSVIYQLKNQQQNRPLFQKLSQCSIQIVNLVQLYQEQGDIDRAEDFVKILADFARKSRKMFVCNYDRNIQQFLLKLISFLQNPQLNNVYESLSDAFEGILKQIQKNRQGSIPFNQDIFHLMNPLYNALAYSCQFTNNIVLQLNHTQQSKAHHISSATQKLIKHRQFTETIFEVMSQVQTKPVYVKAVAQKMKSLSPDTDPLFWPKLEIYLYSLMDAVQDYPSLDESAVSIVSMYIELTGKGQPLPICVHRAYLRVLRGLTTCPQKDPQMMYRILCASISCFNEPLLYSVAQKTFEKACQQNKHISTDIFGQFSYVFEQYPQRAFIVKGLVTMMCHDSELTKKYYLNALNFLFQKYNNEAQRKNRRQYMHSIIQAIKAFKQSPMLAQHHSLLVQFVKQNWNIIKVILSQPKKVKDDQDSDVQKIVRILKVIMRTLEFHFSPFLEQMFTLVLSAFQKYPICSYVYMVQVAVTIYSADPNYTDYLRKLYSDFCDITFNHMSRINGQDLARFSYLLDDYMGMNKRFFLFNASIVLSSGKLPAIIDLCINAFMGCDVPRIAKAAYSFFQTIFMVYWSPQHLQHRNSKQDITPFIPKPEDGPNYQALKQFLIQKIQKIVSKMLEHLSSAPTEQTRDYILDSLVSQIKAFVNENPSVWRNLLKQISLEILVEQQKQRMVQMLESLKGLPFEESRKMVRNIDKMLVLMNRRMDNANNRRNMFI